MSNRDRNRPEPREAIGNNARNTDAEPRPAIENDGQKGRERPDEFDADLNQDFQRDSSTNQKRTGG